MKIGVVARKGDIRPSAREGEGGNRKRRNGSRPIDGLRASLGAVAARQADIRREEMADDPLRGRNRPGPGTVSGGPGVDAAYALGYILPRRFLHPQAAA